MTKKEHHRKKRKDSVSSSRSRGAKKEAKKAKKAAAKIKEEQEEEQEKPTAETKAQQLIAQFTQQQQKAGLSFSFQGTMGASPPCAGDLHARKVYVGGVPKEVQGEQVIKFLIETLTRAGGVIDPGNPVLKTFINAEKRFIFIEFRSVEEACAMIQLDGIRFQGAHNLRIRWTDDYEKLGPIRPRRPVPQIDAAALGIISTKVEEGPLKVFVGGLPKELTEEHIKNLLLNYGRLKSFHLVRDTKDLSSSRGFAFCEYTDERGVQNALRFLNGLKVYGRSINVRRTQGGGSAYLIPASQLTELEKRQFEGRLDEYIEIVNDMFSDELRQQPVSTLQFGEELEKHNENMQRFIKSEFNYDYTSTVIELKLPAVDPRSLEDENTYRIILADMTDELRKFGALRQFFVNGEEQREVFLPRPRDLSIFATVKESAVGKAFAEFEEVTAAFACYNLLNQKLYMGQPVEINFFNKDHFLTKNLY